MACIGHKLNEGGIVYGIALGQPNLASNGTAASTVCRLTL